MYQESCLRDATTKAQIYRGKGLYRGYIGVILGIIFGKIVIILGIIGVILGIIGIL